MNGLGCFVPACAYAECPLFCFGKKIQPQQENTEKVNERSQNLERRKLSKKKRHASSFPLIIHTDGTQGEEDRPRSPGLGAHIGEEQTGQRAAEANRKRCELTGKQE